MFSPAFAVGSALRLVAGVGLIVAAGRLAGPSGGGTAGAAMPAGGAARPTE